MSKEHGFCDVYDYGDNLKPGDELKIEHSISFRRDRLDPAEYAELTALSIEELDVFREHSAAAEQKIFENLREAVKEWEAQAANTLLLDKAIEYVKTPAVEHTGNQWRENRYGTGQEVSNKVYRMCYQVNEDTTYNRDTGQREPTAWRVTWDVWTNEPPRDGMNSGHRIAGQFRKRFTDKSAMEKYLNGRIKAYAGYFTEVSPPIPKSLAARFELNGQLLPGYTVEESKKEHGTADKLNGGVSVSKEKPSVLGQLAASKQETRAADSPTKPKKSHDQEL